MNPDTQNTPEDIDVAVDNNIGSKLGKSKKMLLGAAILLVIGLGAGALYVSKKDKPSTKPATQAVTTPAVVAKPTPKTAQELDLKSKTDLEAAKKLLESSVSKPDTTKTDLNAKLTTP
jgi:uncharacterized protein HemX